MNTEYVNLYDYYIMSETLEPQKDAKRNEKIITHLATGLQNDDILDTFTLQDIFYVEDKFVYSPDITLPDYHGPYYNGKHPLFLLKKEFLTDSNKPLFKDKGSNTGIWFLTPIITKRIDKMINLIQHLLQDEPNRRDESNREFIQRFFEKRTDYTEQQYEEDKAKFKIKMEETLEELKNQDNAKEYIRDIKGLLTGIYDPEPEPDPVSDEPVSEPVSVSKPESKSKSKPVSTPEPETCNSGCLPFIIRKNKTKKLVSKSKSKKPKSKSKKNTGKRRKRNQLQREIRRPRKLFIRNIGPKTRKINR
jgi:hypothetical protein